MAYNLRTRLHFLTRLAGFLVFFLGVFIVASGIKVRNLLTGELVAHYGFGHNTCQYWAGIPTMLTGLFLMIVWEDNLKWKYFSFCCVVVTMVLSQGIIIMESTESVFTHRKTKDSSICKDLEDMVEPSRRNLESDCDKLQKAHPWYLILLFAADIVSVLCFLATLLLFADWILFVAPKVNHNDQVAHDASHQLQLGRNSVMPSDFEAPNQAWNY